jgi:hypothetical protein
MATLDEIAKATVFLAADGSSDITGIELSSTAAWHKSERPSYIFN